MSDNNSMFDKAGANDNEPEDNRTDFTKPAPASDQPTVSGPVQIEVLYGSEKSFVDFAPDQRASHYLKAAGIGTGLLGFGSGKNVSIKLDGRLQSVKMSDIVPAGVTQIVVNTKVHNG